MIGIDGLYQHLEYKQKTKKINITREDTKKVIKKLRQRLEIIQTKKIISRGIKAWFLYKNSDYAFKTFISDLIFD